MYSDGDVKQGRLWRRCTPLLYLDGEVLLITVQGVQFSLNRVSIIHFKCCKIICQKQNCLRYLSSVNKIGSISAPPALRLRNTQIMWYVQNIDPWYYKLFCFIKNSTASDFKIDWRHENVWSTISSPEPAFPLSGGLGERGVWERDCIEHCRTLIV